MPRCKALERVREIKRPAEAGMQDALNGWQKSARITDTELADRLGVAVDTVRHKRQRGVARYTLKDIKDWSNAIGIPPEEMANRFYEYLNK